MEIRGHRVVETVVDVLCDQCGDSCTREVHGEVLHEYATLSAGWGYGSRHDGQRYSLQLCERCFFAILASIEHNKFISSMFDDEPYQRGEQERRAAAEVRSSKLHEQRPLAAQPAHEPASMAEGAEAKGRASRHSSVQSVVALLDDERRSWSARELADLLDGVFTVYAGRGDVLPQDIRRQAVGVFGDTRSADAWLRDAHPLLGGQSPIEVIHTPQGQEQVLDILGRIERGSYS